MGKFINTTHTDNINQLVKSTKSLLNNPFYLYNNKPATIVDYYNINKEMTTLDDGFKNVFTDSGSDSSFIYNIVTNFIIYGLEQIQVQLENDEFGVESGEISGEVVILPNTIIPYAGDYFKIKYIEEEFMFKVIDVTPDTLENGSNIYKIGYKLDNNKNLNIKDKYDMITNNVGTGFNTIIQSDKVSLIKKLEEYLYNLKVYYVNNFYNERVQSFIYKFREFLLYDPYMTQFLIDNKILKGGEEYIYIRHNLSLPSYFKMEYNKSFYKCLESKDLKRLRGYKIRGICRYIESKETNIFSSRPEEYFLIDLRYTEEEYNFYYSFPCFTEDMINHIESRTLYRYDDDNRIYNIIIKYFNNMDISDEDIDILDLDIYNNIVLFYIIPSIIFCIEQYIQKMMVK